MPQVDLESLVSACAGGGSSDRKVACETTLAVVDDETDFQPPQSIWLSGDAEFDWFDRNAVVYERKESTKGSSSIFATSSNPGSNNNSQRFSKNLMKSKATIIGLPKSQKSAFADASKSRRVHHNARLFPKRSASVGKSGSVAVYEPSSPKVSCIGRVRSSRNRRFRSRQRSISSSSAVAAAASATSTAAIARQKSSRSGRRKTGFFESVRAIFRSGRRGKPVQKPDPSSEDSSKKKKNKSRKSRGNSDNNKASQNDKSFNESVSVEPPGLGSLNRFASGRRSESWRVVTDSEIHVAQ
ncbi:hypothetical protein PIB30_040443 [Stylosanthes scabra]|uniref:Uncharacterized protein n=1 Tax=Stylosanthes scabra TaxID=79078 RepID=A0ABU6UEE2_9FABA|nr:hypothetical protein [Stylosanthes scabra]